MFLAPLRNCYTNCTLKIVQSGILLLWRGKEGEVFLLDYLCFTIGITRINFSIKDSVHVLVPLVKAI